MANTLKLTNADCALLAQALDEKMRADLGRAIVCERKGLPEWAKTYRDQAETARRILASVNDITPEA